MADDKKYFRLRKPGESLDPVPPSKTFKLYMKDIDDPDAVDDNQEIVFPLKKPGDGVPLFLEIIQDVAACDSASYYFLYGHNSDRIYPGGFVILYVYGGVPPFSWIANTPGYSFNEVSTDVRWNTLTADPTTGIGDVQVTIEDLCGTQVSGKIENQGVTATMVDSLIDAMQGAVDESFLAAELASRLDLLELNDGRLNVFDGWRSVTVDPALTDYGQRISDAEIAVSANEAQIALSVIDINTIQDALNTPTTGITALVAAAQIDIASNADDINTLSASIESRVAIAVASDPTVTGLDTRVGAAETTLSTWFDPTTGSIYAAYNVKLNADGVISGFGLMSYGPNMEVGDPGHSEFVILADQFIVALPGVTGGDPVAAFEVGEVDGVPSIVAKQAIFGDATITNATIVDLDAEKINAGTIDVRLSIIAPYIANDRESPSFVLDMVNDYLRISDIDAGDWCLDGNFGFTNYYGIAAYTATAGQRVGKYWRHHSASSVGVTLELRGDGGSACVVFSSGSVGAITPINPDTGEELHIPIANGQDFGAIWKVSKSADWAHATGEAKDQVTLAFEIYDASNTLLTTLYSYHTTVSIEPSFHQEMEALTCASVGASYMIPRLYANGTWTAGELLVDSVRIIEVDPITETSVTLNAGDLLFERGGLPYKSVKRIHSGLCYDGVPYNYPVPFVTTPTLIFMLEEAVVYDKSLATTSPHSAYDQVLRMYATDESVGGFTPHAETFTLASFWQSASPAGHVHNAGVSTYSGGLTLTSVGTQRNLPYGCQDSNYYILDSADWGTAMLAFRAKITCQYRVIVSVYREQVYGSGTFTLISQPRAAGNYSYDFPSSWFAINGNRCRYIFALYSDDNALIIITPYVLNAIQATSQGGTMRFLAIEEGGQA